MLNKKEFESILQKYLSGQSTPEEEQLMERWYAAIPETKDTLNFLEKIALRRKLKGKLTGARRKQGGVRENAGSFFLTCIESISSRPAVSLALAFSLAAVVIALFFIDFPTTTTNESKRVSNLQKRIENNGNHIRSIQCTDGSVVNLYPGAIVEIGSFTNDKREVFLRKGEAFFNVKRDENRPFIVYANEIVTRVLGTSFSVQAETSDVTVSVKTGRVSVSKQAEPGSKDEPVEVVLTANQKAIFDARENKLSKALVEKPQLVVPVEELEVITFEEAAVPTILEAVEKAYGVNIEFDQAALASCTLTTYLRENENLYERLDIICSAIGATYTVDGAQVKISSRGCGGD
jgi:transmembrane sensor